MSDSVTEAEDRPPVKIAPLIEKLRARHVSVYSDPARLGASLGRTLYYYSAGAALKKTVESAGEQQQASPPLAFEFDETRNPFHEFTTSEEREEALAALTAFAFNEKRIWVAWWPRANEITSHKVHADLVFFRPIETSPNPQDRRLLFEARHQALAFFRELLGECPGRARDIPMHRWPSPNLGLTWIEWGRLLLLLARELQGNAGMNNGFFGQPVRLLLRPPRAGQCAGPGRHYLQLQLVPPGPEPLPGEVGATYARPCMPEQLYGAGEARVEKRARLSE